MEFGITELNGHVNGPLGFEIHHHFLLALFGHDRPDLENQAVFGTAVLELEPLLGGHDGVQDRLPRALRLDVGRDPLLFGQLVNHVSDLALGWDDNGYD